MSTEISIVPIRQIHIFERDRFESVEGDSVMTTVDVKDKVLVSPLEHLITAIVRLLQGSPSGVMMNKDIVQVDIVQVENVRFM